MSGYARDSIWRLASIPMRPRPVAFWIIPPVFLSTLAASALAAHDSPPQSPSPIPWRAEYRATLDGSGPIRARAIRELLPLADGSWLYRFRVDSLFVDLDERSQFHWRDNQVVPQLYAYRRSAWFQEREAWLSFDWRRLQVLNNVQNQPWRMPIVEGTQDKLSYQLQIQMDLLAGKEHLSYQIADGGHLKHMEFQLRGEEVLHTRLGPLTTVYLDMVAEHEDERAARLWFAKDWHYLPVRMILREPDGRRYEVNLVRARINGRLLE